MRLPHHARLRERTAHPHGPSATRFGLKHPNARSLTCEDVPSGPIPARE